MEQSQNKIIIKIQQVQKISSDSIFKTFSKIIALTALMIVLLWIMFKVSGVLLVFILAMVFALILNGPVSWLEKRKIKRVWASAIVFAGLMIVVGLLSWLVIPKIAKQLQTLIYNLPVYASQMSARLSLWLKDYPEIIKEINSNGSSVSQIIPNASSMITKAGNLSIYIAGSIFLFILFVCIIGYAVAKPAPLLEIYFSFFSIDKREKAEKALMHTSEMLIGWIKANLIGGGILAVCTTTFLSIMNVPGAWVWGALVLVAEMIPNLGFYIMSIPPFLVAFSVGPYTALWVFVFFVAMSEIMSDFVMPRLLASKMKIHPVSLLFMLLVMGVAFGLVGAFLTVPVTAIIKAYYEAFFKIEQEKDPLLNERIDTVIYHHS